MKNYNDFISKIAKIGCGALILHALLTFAGVAGVYAILCAMFDWTFRFWVSILLWIFTIWFAKTM